jgi:hypothetical protein
MWNRLVLRRIRGGDKNQLLLGMVLPREVIRQRDVAIWEKC